MSTQRGNKNSDAIRILQRDRDASARATHLKAEIGMVPNSTIERKIMSTKTSIKRIALVAAAALTLGGFSAVSASAAQSVAQTYINCTGADIAGGTITPSATAGATCNGVAGSSNYVTLTSVTQAKDVQITVTGTTLVAGTTGTKWVIASGAASATIAGADTGAGSSNNTIRVMTPSAGTITVSISAATANSGVFAATTETVVITVNATASSGTYSVANSTVYIGSGEVGTLAADATTAIVKQKTYTSTDSATASIIVSYLDGVSTGSAIRDTLTATISTGPGTLAPAGYTSVLGLEGGAGAVYDSRTVAVGALKTQGNTSGLVNALSSVNNYSTSVYTDRNGLAGFFLFANGLAGVSTVTIKNSTGTVIGTKTVTFTGTDVSSISLTINKPFVNGDTAQGVTTNVFIAVLKDSAGNVVSGLTWAPTITYSSAVLGSVKTDGSAGVDTATSTSTGTVNYSFKAPTTVAYGPVTVTFTDPTTKATASGVVTVSSAVAATLTVSAPSVDLGNTFSYTVTAKDANGYAIPDGSIASNYITSVTSNAGIGSADLTTTSALGVFALKVTGPVVSVTTGKGSFLLTGTAGTANSYLAKTLTGTTVDATFSVIGGGGDSSLAYDAASAATDAANNAYEEAQNATQAASDALAAVKALAVQVKALIALVNKIKAKLKA